MNKSDFDFVAFFKKYNLCYSDIMISRVVQCFDDPEWIYRFCLHYSKNRCPELEPLVLTNARACYWYALHVIKDRWPEAEPIMKKDLDIWGYYIDDFQPKETL